MSWSKLGFRAKIQGPKYCTLATHDGGYPTRRHCTEKAMDAPVLRVTKAEAAEELEISLSTLDRRISKGEVEVLREGSRVYVRMHAPDCR